MASEKKTMYKRKNNKTKKRRVFIILIELLLMGAVFIFKSTVLRILLLAIIVLLPVYLNMQRKAVKKTAKSKLENTEYKNLKPNYSDLRVNYNENNDIFNEERNYRLKRYDDKNINFIIERDEEELSSGNKKPFLKDEDEELREKVHNWIEALDYSTSVFRRIIDNTKAEIKKEEIENSIKEGEEDDRLGDVEEVYAEDSILDVMKEVYEKDAVPDVMEEANEKDDASDVMEKANEKDDASDVMEEANEKGDASDVIEKVYRKDYISDVMKEANEKGDVSVDIEKANTERYMPDDIQYPPIDLLEKPDYGKNYALAKFNARKNAEKLINTLNSFGVKARIINISKGPSVTRYELQPDYGVKVSKIVNLTDDIALNLAAPSVRIEAPIPGKSAIGIEVPNKKVMPVLLREVIESHKFLNYPSKLAFAVGKDIAGTSVIADIASMPHLLIAGATGSGKSVCINALIISLLYRATPEEVKFLMIDPKMVELGIYNGIPHLLIPVVTDPKKAAGALNWAVQEMTNRYKLFAENSVRDLKGYNDIMTKKGEEPLPQIVIIIDELSDLMMVAPNDVEDCICRLAQMARAAGMHLVIATQRPSVNVITGVIKANIPSRISFAVSSQVDSRTILDMAGAEKLLGKGDMLFSPLGMSKPVRVQGALITDKEVESVVSFIKQRAIARYDENILKEIESKAEPVRQGDGFDDEILPQVIDMVIEQGQASTSLIQRKFKLGYSRASRILDIMEEQGIVGPFEGSKPRKVLITKNQWEERKL